MNTKYIIIMMNFNISSSEAAVNGKLADASQKKQLNKGSEYDEKT